MNKKSFNFYNISKNSRTHIFYLINIFQYAVVDTIFPDNDGFKEFLAVSHTFVEHTLFIKLYLIIQSYI